MYAGGSPARSAANAGDAYPETGPFAAGPRYARQASSLTARFQTLGWSTLWLEGVTPRWSSIGASRTWNEMGGPPLSRVRRARPAARPPPADGPPTAIRLESTPRRRLSAARYARPA